MCACVCVREEECCGGGGCSPGVVHSAQTWSRLFSRDVYIRKMGDGGEGGGQTTALRYIHFAHFPFNQLGMNVENLSAENDWGGVYRIEASYRQKEAWRGGAGAAKCVWRMS